MSGYPTLKLFFDGAEVAEYQGPRRAQPMLQFIDQLVAERRARGESRVFLVENSENAQNFKDMIQNKSVFAAFCTARHPTCTALRPAFDKLSGLMEDTDVMIAWVDCDRVQSTCADLG